MHIFFPSRKSKDSFILQGEELRHFKVRRIKKEEKVGIIWEGSLYLCELERAGSKEAKLRIIERIETKEPAVMITLIQAVPVALRTFEAILQKSTELGVSEVVPLLTDRSFKNREVMGKKRERWERIIREAMKQSGRPYTLELRDPMYIDELEPKSELNIILDNFSDGKRVKELELEGVKSVSLVVGPEGGFSKSEVRHLTDKGFIPVRLEPHVLRSETAAIVGVGIIANLAGP